MKTRTEKRTKEEVNIMKNKISEYLGKCNKTATEVINEAGIGRTSFYDIMRGVQTPKINTARSIAKALNAPIHKIFPDLKDVI